MESLSERLDIDYQTFLDALDYIDDEIWVIDGDHTILYVNKVVEKHFGLPRERYIGRKNWEFFYGSGWNPKLLPLVYQTKRAYVCRQKNPTATTITSATPILSQAGMVEYIVLIARYLIAPDDFYFPTITENPIPAPAEEPAMFIGPSMREPISLANKIADLDANIMVLGESGTGKSLLAEYIHNHSGRKENAFISINCASIPENLIESELFGYVRGAFTGASASGKEGLFKQAHRGTLFLDEIGDLPLSAQAKLLHVIQAKEILPVGSEHPVKLDMRIIAATNGDLKQMVELKRFRQDLYYRLNTFEIFLPSLCSWGEDLEDLIVYFLLSFNAKYEKDHSLSPEVMDMLLQYPWPGNIREMQHLMERLVVLVDEYTIEVRHLPSAFFSLKETAAPRNSPPSFEIGSFDERMENYERELVLWAAEKYKTSVAVAKNMGISQSKASRLIRKYVKK